MKTSRPTGYLNVDLEIEASSSLARLEREMGDSVFVLHSGPFTAGKWLLAVENSHGRAKTPDASAAALCSVVERLSAAGRQVWERARRKEFDVGYELRVGERMVRCPLKHKTIQRIVALGATIAFSCYRDHNSEPAAVGNAG